jgi:hypothetical protein
MVVGPLGALINPPLDEGDLLSGKSASWRHLLTKGVTDQALVQFAALAVARTDDDTRAAAKGISASIKAKPVHLLRGTMTANAVLPQKRLNVTRKVNSVWNLRGERDIQHRSDDYAGHRDAREHADHPNRMGLSEIGI